MLYTSTSVMKNKKNDLFELVIVDKGGEVVPIGNREIAVKPVCPFDGYFQGSPGLQGRSGVGNCDGLLRLNTGCLDFSVFWIFF